jgi:hypothetical protein
VTVKTFIFEALALSLSSSDRTTLTEMRRALCKLPTVSAYMAIGKNNNNNFALLQKLFALPTA